MNPKVQEPNSNNPKKCRMSNSLYFNKVYVLISFLLFSVFCSAENVPIEDYSVNNIGQVQLTIQAQADKYYLLHALHGPNLIYESITSLTLGVDGTLIISEPAGAYDLQNYCVTEHSIANPDDSDGDGIDDISEFNNMPTDAPLNYAEAISFVDGTTSIDNAETFAQLAVVEDVPWAPFLDGQQYVKFGILDRDTDQPKVYFINSNTHIIHEFFFDAIDATVIGDDGSGEIVFNPNEILPNGVIGSYSFNFSFGQASSFEATQRTFELLVASMPFLQNNMQHFIGDVGEMNYNSQYKDDYIGSRINVVLESDVFSDIDYIPLHKAEGFGFFRAMTLDENPGSRDIVLYDALPNSLPRVGGIITSVVQTPLSHVNLRAIQDNVPNAYIKDPLLIDSIANLVGSYIYYRVEDEKYFIREATLDEVNDWYEKLRPTEDQIPDRDLSFTSILPLDSIEFEMSTAFGAKCSNVATMRKFGFPEGTIPNGFGIPFYFYDEFMKFNNFYEVVEEMISDPTFINDIETRIDKLKDFRSDIKDAPMPPWMLDHLEAMHNAFPEGTSVRCRSSTNNEDLPGFSGAGLYTSKTQHPIEGHISKSIKQVYASMWNFRAYEERDFYRVDHYIAAMGVLCHPNFEEEKSNGVGVSIDPIYQTESTYYLNSQIGEFLITNPDENSIPEELLLYEDASLGYLILRESNLVDEGELVMEDEYLDQLRDFLKVIHEEFAILYDVVGAEGFGMDIEYKVTAENQLVIKQARPWVSFWADINANFDLGVSEISKPNTSASLGDSEIVSAIVSNQGLNDMSDFDLSLYVGGVFVEELFIPDTIKPFNSEVYQFTIPQDFSEIGEYEISAIVIDSNDGYSNNDTLEVIIQKLHFLEGEISIKNVNAICNGEVEVKAAVKNLGEDTFLKTEIEVISNGMIVDTFIYNTGIPYLAEVSMTILVSENLVQSDNLIELRLLKVNDEEDAIIDNNLAVITTDLDSEYNIVTLVINPDAYPEEISWQIRDEFSNEIIAAGMLPFEAEEYSIDICVDYGSCLTLTVFDSYGDGIFDPGNFYLEDAAGNTLVFNDGNYGFFAEEVFCPDGEGCAFSAEIIGTNLSTSNAADGIIEINIINGLSPFQYSIDGGITFFEESTFSELDSGSYDIVINDATGLCSYEETVTIGVTVVNSSNENSLGEFIVYPNPFSDQLSIEFPSNLILSDDMLIEVYNSLGNKVQADIKANPTEKSTFNLSLEGHPAGIYFIKCYNNSIEKYFSVVKI